jgi:hypothetical protein
MAACRDIRGSASKCHSDGPIGASSNRCKLHLCLHGHGHMEAGSHIIMVDLGAYRGWIEAALEYSGGTHSFDDIAAGIASGHMQLWPTEKACAVTEIVVYPQKKVLHVFLAAGDLEQITNAIGAVEEWGKAQGCESLTMNGRFGWQRVLNKRGWSPTMVIMERSL